jgi:hypothetical protein
LGVSDGANTEVSADESGKLPEGLEVIVGDTIADSGGDASANPFIPQFGKGQGDRRNHRTSS